MVLDKGPPEQDLNLLSGLASYHCTYQTPARPCSSPSPSIVRSGQPARMFETLRRRTSGQNILRVARMPL
ncbi:hypothetical protein PsYK624_115370 [Phanerochaete sordida]|uniref:Uncharacterized protein n=1 Tax=Phanerochaete sordida TaxID=48140 RepID=A0A9P3LHU0_9APHY|nr:hypothetical protein PsYK624_115370 [Phanerochaete sordida]